MRAIHITTLFVIIAGGLDWWLIGLFEFDLMEALFGSQTAAKSKAVYLLVGLSAIWQLVAFFKSASGVPKYIE